MIQKRKSKITSEDIVFAFKEVHGERYDYSKVGYATMHKNVIVICHIHGEFEVNPRAHLTRKVNCSKCMLKIQQERQKDTTENFIQKAKKIHQNRYDYSLVKYGNTAHDKVKIICRLHGEFLISPNSHLSKKANCVKCSQISSKRKLEKEGNLGWNKEQWIKRCKGRKPFVYILKCWNEEESFIKIGITSKPLKRRFTTKERMPYNYEVLKTIESNNAGYIYDLENILLRNSKHQKYVPKIDFHGKTECRTPDFNYAEAH